MFFPKPFYGCGSYGAPGRAEGILPRSTLNELEDLPTEADSNPVIQNEAMVTGRIISVVELSPSEENIQTDRTVYRLELFVEEVRNMEGMRNLLQNRTGKIISVYTKEGLSPGLEGRLIRTNVSVRGDERGARFWAWGIQVLDHVE
jgi:DNA-directed RNA polymerase subunit H (RpoH/RPB5)